MRIVLTGGGTAGHVIPNLALAPVLAERGFEIAYIGQRGGMEAEMAAAAGLDFHGISAGKLRRYLSLENLTDVFRVVRAIVQAWRLLGRLRPAAVFSKGGFVAFPVVLAAWLRHIPVLAHESDLTPGLANRLSRPFVTAMLVAFADSVPLLGGDVEHVGLPLRPGLLRGDAAAGRAMCGAGLRDGRPLLLAMGGSLGADAINRALRSALPRLLAGFDVVHITGRGRLLPEPGRRGYVQFEFVGEGFGDLLAAADLVISRAGATSVYELLALRKPHLLIPLSRGASRGDQIANAAQFERIGTSVVLAEERLSAATLCAALAEVERRREALVAAMEKLDLGDATQAIAARIEDLARGSGG